MLSLEGPVSVVNVRKTAMLRHSLIRNVAHNPFCTPYRTNLAAGSTVLN